MHSCYTRIVELFYKTTTQPEIKPSCSYVCKFSLWCPYVLANTASTLLTQRRSFFLPITIHSQSNSPISTLHLLHFLLGNERINQSNLSLTKRAVINLYPSKNGFKNCILTSLNKLIALCHRVLYLLISRIINIKQVRFV